MPISDIYTVSSGTVTVATATAQQPVLTLYTATTKRAWIVGVRIDILSTTAAAGNNSLFQLMRVSNASSVTAGAVVTANLHDLSALAALSTSFSASTAFGVAPTLTANSQFWEQELPQTTGSSWEEFPPSGYEWGVAAASGARGMVAMVISQSVATSTTYSIDLVFSE